MDTDADTLFDNILATLTKQLFIPMASITLVDSDRQWFKSTIGLSDGTETCRNVSFCAHTVLKNSVLVVEDTYDDHRFSHNPSVIEHSFIRSYHGLPLCPINNLAVGTLCVMDTKPRVLNAQEQTLLVKMSLQIEHLMRLGKQLHELNTDKKVVGLN